MCSSDAHPENANDPITLTAKASTTPTTSDRTPDGSRSGGPAVAVKFGTTNAHGHSHIATDFFPRTQFKHNQTLTQLV